ncbi:MAG: hypothetical protein M1830_005206 [Pleopsidium flavum]|nr:MAG: hypothetical protein M1830_005206 [Pleopsidium flavum]
MSLKDAYGERLIASVIDYYAKKEPGRVWASVPRSEDLSKGFTDITYKQFANAINHACWWLESNLGKSNGGFEVFAYAGPKDQRFPILAVAAVKVGRQILLPSPFATAEAQQHVLKVTKCQVYLHAESMRTGIERIVGERASIRQVTVPEIAEWLSQEEAHLYVYNKSWDEAKLEPWIIFHTSGTTGKALSPGQRYIGVELIQPYQDYPNQSHIPIS